MSDKKISQLSTFAEALNYIKNHKWIESRLGLERIAELLKRLGNPQSSIKIIHIAGTNGKGSTAAMLESILRNAGFKTGLYSSPYIIDFCEQIRVNGVQITEDEFLDVANRIIETSAEMGYQSAEVDDRPVETDIIHSEKKDHPAKIKDNPSEIEGHSTEMDNHPTEFEMITAIALLHFYEVGCEVVILETGMGGRLDATNVIENPVLTVITPISMDHMEFLGDSIEKIAGEKAGIIKRGIPLCSAPQEEGAKRVLENRCGKMDSKLIFSNPENLKRISQDPNGQTFTIPGDLDSNNIQNNKITQGTTAPIEVKETNTVATTGATTETIPTSAATETIPTSAATEKINQHEYYLPLIGSHQLINSSLALTCIYTLHKLGWTISDYAIKNGLANTSWPGRMELLTDKPVPTFLDGAHNIAGIKSALNTLSELYSEKKIIFVFGTLRLNEKEAMLELLRPLAKKIIPVDVDNLQSTASRINPNYMSAAQGITKSDNTQTGLGNEITDANEEESVNKKTEAMQKTHGSQITDDTQVAPHSLPADKIKMTSIDLCPEEGLAKAIKLAEPDDVICVLGSLYLARFINKNKLS